MGGQRLLVVPPEFAYGSRGKPPLVPPNSTVEFAVSLLSVRRSGTNPNSVINMVCGAGRWRPSLGLLCRLDGTVRGGDGEGGVCKTCRWVPREGAQNAGERRLMSSVNANSRTTASPCLWLRGLLGPFCWCIMCTVVFSPVRVRKCIDAPFAAGRLGCSTTSRTYACSGPLYAVSSHILLLAILWHVLLCLNSLLQAATLYRHPLEHTSTGNACAHLSHQSRLPNRMLRPIQTRERVHENEW